MKKLKEGDFVQGELERLASILSLDVSVVFSQINKHRENLLRFSCFELSEGEKSGLKPEGLFILLFLDRIEKFQGIKRANGSLYDDVLNMVVSEILMVLKEYYVPKDVFEALQSSSEREITSINDRYHRSERNYLNENEKRKAVEAENRRFRAMIRYLEEIVHANIDRIAPPEDH